MCDLADVQIDLCFHALAEDALISIMQFQHHMMQTGKDALAQRETSGIATAIRHVLHRKDDELLWPYLKRQLKILK